MQSPQPLEPVFPKGSLRGNPCCRGRCSRSPVSLRKPSITISFNPCCGRRCSRSMTSGKRGVWGCSFNPCCGGRCSRSFSLHFRLNVQLRFQSLFWWKMLSKPPKGRTIFFPKLPFQSLLSWKMLGKEDVLKHGCISGIVFQSLLWWKMLSKIRSTRRDCKGDRVSILVVVEDALEGVLWKISSITGKCFNPCCGGRCSRRDLSILGRLHHTMFQSLLLWKMLSKPPSSTNLRLSRSFNPCCCGRCSRRPCLVLRSQSISVSILFVVEDALEENERYFVYRCSNVSILVVVEDETIIKVQLSIINECFVRPSRHCERSVTIPGR